MLNRSDIRNIASSFDRALVEEEINCTDDLLARIMVVGENPVPVSMGTTNDFVVFRNLGSGILEVVYRRENPSGGNSEEPIALRLDHSHGEGSMIKVSCSQRVEGYEPDSSLRGVYNKYTNSKQFEVLIRELKDLSR